MSDIQDLIHKSTILAFNQGVKSAEERIIKLLDSDCKDGLGDNLQGCFHEVAIALIKGETE